MIRALAYCAFLHAPEIPLPQTGVGAAPVQGMASGELRLLWSEVEWPFRPERMQQNAVEFHGVISQVFRRKAVAPFRLLSVFDDAPALAAFASRHESAFVADLERLKDVVQMECVVYPSPPERGQNQHAPEEAVTSQGPSGSGAEYLRRKAGFLRSAEAYAKAASEALAHLSREVRTRESRNGVRIFVLTERGREGEFRQAVSSLAIPEHLSRRVSGPWPAAEFLSEQVRAPKTAEVK